MSDQLPRREEIAEAAAIADQLRIYQHKGKTDCITYGEVANGRVMLTILRMARLALSGRLVDREAIDYEAALAVARELWTVEPVWDESSLDLVFAAAIGDTG